MAEREGFEPPVPCGTTVFKTVVIDHSTISPSFTNFCKVGKGFAKVHHYSKIAIYFIQKFHFIGNYAFLCQYNGKQITNNIQWIIY